MKIFRAALTQTANVYPMPDSVNELMLSLPFLNDIRTENIERHLELITLAKDYDVSVLCLGELFAWPYFPLSQSDIWVEAAEDLDSGPTILAIAEAARKNRMIIIAPIYEYDKVSNERFDTAVLIGEEGNIVGKYRKSHIPFGKNEMAGFFEKYYFSGSNGSLANNHEYNISSLPHLPVFKTKCGNIGINICYDRHFEGVVKSLVEQGAEIIFCPSATFGADSRRLWDMEFQVDSSRHQVYIGGSNRLGLETPWQVDFFGASYFTSPGGKLDNLSNHPNLIVSEIDLNLTKNDHPAGWHLKNDARTDIFQNS